MHLLAAIPGAVPDGVAVDLDQPPGDIVVLSAADRELACLAAARGNLGDSFPSVRLASLLQLTHPMSVDLHIEKTLAAAKLIVVRLLGGRGYWAYGVDEVVRLGSERGIAIALLPGDDQPDAELARLSSVDAAAWHRLWQYLVHGGVSNAGDFLRYAATLIGGTATWQEPRLLLRAGLYWPGIATPGLAQLRAAWGAERPVAALLFYRALVQAGNLAAIDALINALDRVGLNALPVFVASLKDPVAAATVATAFADAPPAVILNTTGFALSVPGEAMVAGPLAGTDCPVLQVIFAGSDAASWRDGTHGLAARDIAMNVALPEVDGRIVSRAVSFKDAAVRDPLTYCPVTVYRPEPDRIAFVADLAAHWVRLRQTPAAERRVALVLANYPKRDGRLGTVSASIPLRAWSPFSRPLPLPAIG